MTASAAAAALTRTDRPSVRRAGRRVARPAAERAFEAIRYWFIDYCIGVLVACQAKQKRRRKAASRKHRFSFPEDGRHSGPLRASGASQFMRGESQ
jgi:hypothetical protein